MANTKEIFEELSKDAAFSRAFKTQEFFDEFVKNAPEDVIKSFEEINGVSFRTPEPLKKKGPLPSGYQRNTNPSPMFSNVATEPEKKASQSPSQSDGDQIASPQVPVPPPIWRGVNEYGYTAPTDMGIEAPLPPAPIREEKAAEAKKVVEEVKTFKQKGGLTAVGGEDVELPNLSEVIVSEEGGNSVFTDAALKFNATVLDLTANALDVPMFMWRYQNMLGLGDLSQEQIDRINALPPDERDDAMMAELGYYGDDFAVTTFGELYAALNDIADIARGNAESLRARTNRYEKIVDGERVQTTIYDDLVEGSIGRAAGRLVSEAIGSLPTTMTAAATGGPVTLGVLTAVGKTEEELKAGEKISPNLLLASIANGTAEAYFEEYTQNIVRNFGKAAAGDRAISDAIARNYVAAIAEATGTEGTSEAFTSIAQDISDSLFLGKAFSFSETIKKAVNADLIGAASGGGMAVGGAAPVVFRREIKPYVSKLMLDAKQDKFIKDQRAQITQMQAEMEQSIDMKTKAAYQMAINSANKVIESTIEEGSSLVDRASVEQVADLAKIDTDIIDVQDAKKAIEESESMLPEAKQAAINQLDQSLINLNSQKDGIIQEVKNSKTYDDKFAPEVKGVQPTEEPIALPEEIATPIEFSKELEEKYKDSGLSLDLLGSLDKGDLSLSRIVISEEARNQGIGTDVMKDIIEYADKAGKRVTLTPSTDFGGDSTTRLKNFYNRFGFIENKGENKDFTTRDTMYRKPKQKIIESKIDEAPEMSQPTGKEKRPFAIKIEDSKVITEAEKAEKDPFLRRTFKDIRRTFSVLQTLMPGLKIMIHETNAQYLANGNPKNTIGNIKDNVININLEASRLYEGRQSDALKHEGIHPIMQAVFDTKPDTINNLYNELVALQNDTTIGKNVVEALNFGNKYSQKGQQVVKMESLTEFVAFIATSQDRRLEKDPTLLDRLKSLVERIAAAFGINYRVKTTDNLIQLAKAISYTFLKGEDATNILDISREAVVMDSMEESRIQQEDQSALDNTIQNIYNGLNKIDDQGNEVPMTDEEKFNELLNDPSGSGFKYTPNQIARAVPALIPFVDNFHKENAQAAIDLHQAKVFERRNEILDSMYNDPLASPSSIYGRLKQDGYADIEIFNAFVEAGMEPSEINEVFGENYRKTIETLIANEEQSGLNPDFLYSLENDVRNLRITQRTNEMMREFEGIPIDNVISIIESFSKQMEGLTGANASAIDILKQAYQRAEAMGEDAYLTEDEQAAGQAVARLASMSGRLLQMVRGLKKDPNKMAEYLIKDIEGDTYQLTDKQKATIAALLKDVMESKAELDEINNLMQDDISNMTDENIGKSENAYRKYKSKSKALDSFIGALKASQESTASWIKTTSAKVLLSFRTVTIGAISNLENYLYVKFQKPMASLVDMAFSRITPEFSRRTMFLNKQDRVSARKMARARTAYEVKAILSEGADTSYESVRSYANSSSISNGFRDAAMAKKILFNAVAKLSGKKITDYDNLEEFANDFDILLVKLEDNKGLDLGSGKRHKQLSILLKGFLGVVPEIVGRSLALSGDRSAFNLIKARAIADYARSIGITDQEKIEGMIQLYMSSKADDFIGEQEAQSQIFINDNKVIKAIGKLRGGIDSARTKLIEKEKRRYKSSWVSRFTPNVNRAAIAGLNALDLLVMFPMSPYVRVPSNVVYRGISKTYVPLALFNFTINTSKYITEYNSYVKKYGAENLKTLTPSQLKNKNEAEKKLFYLKRKASISASEIVLAYTLNMAFRYLLEAGLATPPAGEKERERVMAGKEGQYEPGTITVGDMQLSYPNLGIFGLGLSMYASDWYLSKIDENKSAKDWITMESSAAYMALNAFGNSVENLSFIKGLGDFVSLFQTNDRDKLARYLTGPFKIYGSILAPNLFSFVERGSDFYMQNLGQMAPDSEEIPSVLKNPFGLAALNAWTSLSGRTPFNALRSPYYNNAVGEYGDRLDSRNTVFEPGSVWAYLQTSIDPTRFRTYTLPKEKPTQQQQAAALRGEEKFSEKIMPVLMDLGTMNIDAGGTGDFYKAIVTFFPNNFKYGNRSVSLPFDDYVKVKTMLGKEKAKRHALILDQAYNFYYTLGSQYETMKENNPDNYDELFKEYVFETTEKIKNDLMQDNAIAKKNVFGSTEVRMMIEKHLRNLVSKGEVGEDALQELLSMPGTEQITDGNESIIIYDINARDEEDPAFPNQ